jgi:hypothetical protein
MNNIMVLGSTLGRCETHHECQVKYGNSLCINKNKKGVGHCTKSLMSKITSLGGKRKTNKKRRKTNKKRRKTNKKRR